MCYDKIKMHTFNCNGWLDIALDPDSDRSWIQLRHDTDHVHYWNIDVPQDVIDLVKNNPELKTSQVR